MSFEFYYEVTLSLNCSLKHFLVVSLSLKERNRICLNFAWTANRIFECTGMETTIIQDLDLLLCIDTNRFSVYLDYH